MYASGRGVVQDYKMSYVWSSVATANGHIEALKLRDATAKMLTPAELDEAQALATRYFKQNQAIQQ